MTYKSKIFHRSALRGTLVLPLLMALLMAFAPATSFAFETGATAATVTNGATLETGEPSGIGYVARKDGLRTFFNALSARLKKPVIVSQKASRKQISGDFDLANPQALLESIATKIGLIWYHDGQTIYVYDAAEIRSAMVASPNGSLATLNEFLRKAGLYDRRYPLRDGGGSGLFYVSGPPIYVELVENAMRFLGKQHGGDGLGKLRIEVVRLENTFVVDRTLNVRDSQVTVPGIATVIEQLLRDEQIAVDVRVENELTPNNEPAESGAPSSPSSLLPSQLQHARNSTDMPPFPADGTAQIQAQTQTQTRTVLPYPPPVTTLLPPRNAAGDPKKIRVIAYRDTNSLLIRGTQEQVDFIKHLIGKLDIAKRHIELSLWIIDLKKGDLEQLGVNWSGGVSMKNAPVGATFNNAISTLDGASFVAAITALENNEQSRIVSRPVVLTQENVPALFDNNQTVYTKLLAERMVQMEKVTFGTMISVLPRFAQDDEIEMSLTIEDGSQLGGDHQAGSDINVSRTHISTVARVPKGMSLLIGGYTRDVSTDTVSKIPLLGDLPGIGGLFRSRKVKQDSLVRVFLIQPKQIQEALRRDASDLSEEILSQPSGNAQQKLLRDYMERKNGDQ
ncbi:MAG TPA: type III secretion system outer membrane ring subunit SctC [Herbaspirillum sp.]|jgi:type III secretion protein C